MWLHMTRSAASGAGSRTGRRGLVGLTSPDRPPATANTERGERLGPAKFSLLVQAQLAVELGRLRNW